MDLKVAVKWGSRLLLGGLMVPAAWADRVHLSTGQTVEGIIVNETATEVKVQVLRESYLTLDRAMVETIEGGSDADHDQLRREWEEAAQEAQARQQERVAFEEAQRAKGLVKYQGQWIAKEELEAMQQQAELAQQEQVREEEAKRTDQLIQELREENARLQELVQVFQQELMRRPVVLRHDAGLFQDEQGNLVRIQRHEGHEFFVNSDGRHVDLQIQEDAFVYTDPQGTQRTLTPAH